jgi:hypothetical protein
VGRRAERGWPAPEGLRQDRHALSHITVRVRHRPLPFCRVSGLDGRTSHVIVDKSKAAERSSQGLVVAAGVEGEFGMKVTTGPIRFAGMRVVDTVPDGTRVTFTGGGQSGGFFRIAEPVLARLAEPQLTADLAALKHILEAPA